MPSNKKPRKRYHPKPVSFGYNVQEIERIKEIWQRVEFGAYISLPNGSAVIDDLLCIRDMINVCLVSLHIRKDLEEETAKSAWEILHKAGDATRDIIYRGCEARHFVAKGDELKHINDAVRICGEYIQESLTVCPSVFMQEWATARVLSLGSGHCEHRVISSAVVRKTYYSMTPEKYARIRGKHEFSRDSQRATRES